MSHVSELIISVRDLYVTGIPTQAIAEHLNVSIEMIEKIIEVYCNDEDD